MLTSRSMADQFEVELQTLVAKVARELAHDITRLILKRLGIEGTLRVPRGDKRLAAGAVSKALRQVEKGRARRPAPARGREKAAPPPPRQRPSAEERAEASERIAMVVEGASGLSVGEIERQSGLPRGVVLSSLKALKEQGRLFMGGTKRFARYALTQAAADKASVEARGGSSE